MNIGKAFSNGVRFGATLGTLASAAVLIGGGTLMLPFLFPAMSGAAPGFLAIIPDLILSTLAGAAIFGTLFAATHAVVHSVPGLSTVAGEPRRSRFEDLLENKRSRNLGHGNIPISKMSAREREARFVDKHIIRTDYVRDNWREQIEDERMGNDHHLLGR